MYSQYYINQVVFYRFLFVVIFVFSIAPFTSKGLNAQVPDFKWMHPAGVVGNDEGNDLVIDGAINSYVVGRFIRIADYSDSALIGVGSQEVFIAKYDLNGNDLWTKRAGSASNDPEADRGSAIGVEKLGNILMTGRFVSNADFGTNSLTSADGQDFFIGKLAEQIVLINEVVTDPQQDWTDNSGGNGVQFDSKPGNGTISNTDEWLEIYNAGVSAIDLTEGTGWTLDFIDGSDATLDFQNPGSTVFVFSDGGSLTNFQPGEFLVIGNPPGSMNNDIFLELKNASGTIVDDVELGDDKESDGDGDGAADGSSNGGNASSIVDEAIARVPNGIDTDNDVNDFIQQHTTIGFANDAAFDFSDAPSGGDAGVPPDSYPTLLKDNGARHVLNGTTFLGFAVDAEPDGQPDATATDDDTNGVPDDEDGVVFTSFLAPGNNATADVTASIAGKLNAWIDFNRDGDWEDANEQIFTNLDLNAGLNSVLTYSVPASALQGVTFARFRFNSTGDLSFDGLALDGEVEDYKVEIGITDCFITPTTDTNQVNSQHSSTVTVQKDGINQQGVEVTFEVFKGPNLGQTGSGTSPTNGSGQATFIYTSNGTAGTDSIKASGSIDGVPFECFAQKVWVDNMCTLEAETDTNQVGTDHTLTVTIKQDGVAKSGIP
ncbi:lamin tail domain-containing protein, partial [candidate division KSB1 bacterium]|nr:lamin tail domain-containing protein [candidate division KSB1 bacterium]